MNSSEIFTLALGLTEPWTITNVEILTDDDSVKALHIHLSFKRGSKFKDEAGEKCSCFGKTKFQLIFLDFVQKQKTLVFFGSCLT